MQFTGIELALDGFLLFITSFAIFSEHSRMKARDILLGLCFVLFCGISRVSVLSGGESFTFSLDTRGYGIVPANSIPLFFLLILAVLVINSLWFKKNASYTFFGTLAVFSVFMISRFLFILFFYGLGTIDNKWNPLISRLGSVFLLCMVLYAPFFKWLKNKLNDGSVLVKLLIGNTSLFLAVLIIFLDFDISKIANNLWLIAGTITVLFLLNLLVGLYEQKRSAQIKRFHMMEQYIPVIEELITQVRARQHEFNNRLLAISAAAQTADTLEQAKAEIAELTEGLQFDVSEKSLLTCDSKMIAGMIFSKIKSAQMKKIILISELNASMEHKSVGELALVEIIGILIDNAVEASNPEDTVYIKADYLDEGFAITVSNPYVMQSATDFVRMFRRGFSTKAEGGTRGHGLANVKEIVDRHHGKIITLNETIQGQNYVTIGVLFS
jgi:signal transduction histidine kinase